ncbi:hypothetical protein KXW98_009222 [Aspergillus fumigatus]|uniref:Uncharacterized protein n=3 Tax=Aspergillus fumigatus TaxID=746128 RepID=A4D9W2_ASPFU|nr:hypothetical protein AFUA_2G05635 [Aspergillus fumigatus Af293]EDP54214.1 hypothetical protein AFUB_022660 [Aspergillus fumigatus A1163]KAF4263376.1 hypothetical protein CNMCM8714_008419 [Aspergillus fumigatus]KMK57918.1 hypothetical protein Y699_03338 [Aspergillus fumigatus Z5]EBA27322.1 hypothetical protein AFUA_2G05635 [Aspergillus fumigatus Af293]KAF4269158.1 hypothetical protein CNMCM8057_008314 [Aspergillus fumigatus]
MQFNLSTICLAAATLFASHTLAAPAPAPVPNPVLIGGPSGHDAGNSVCFKNYIYGAASCPGRAYEDGTCCISDEIEFKIPESKAVAEPASTRDGAGDGDAE